MRWIPILLALAACPGAIDDPERFTRGPECPDVEAELFALRCSSRLCHGAGAESQAGLDLRSPGPESRLVDVASTSKDCDGRLLIDPDEPEASLLLLKLGEDPPCGERMPLVGARLNAFERQCLLDWIERAAADG